MTVAINKEVMKTPQGNFVTQSLFYEYNQQENKDSAGFTIKDEDITRFGKKYLSARKLYLELGDVTEDDFADKYLLGRKHWERLLQNVVIRRHINEWREALERKIRRDAMKSIIKQAEKGNYGAARFLAMGDWKPKQNMNGKKAREKEDAIRQELLDEAEKSDVARLLLVK